MNVSSDSLIGLLRPSVKTSTSKVTELEPAGMVTSAVLATKSSPETKAPAVPGVAVTPVVVSRSTTSAAAFMPSKLMVKVALPSPSSFTPSSPSPFSLTVTSLIKTAVASPSALIVRTTWSASCSDTWPSPLTSGMRLSPASPSALMAAAPDGWYCRWIP